MKAGTNPFRSTSPPRPGNELLGRIMVAVVLSAVTVAAVQAPTPVLTVVLAIAAGLGSYELFENTAARRLKSSRSRLLTSTGCALASAALPVVAYLWPKFHWAHLTLAGLALWLLALSIYLHIWYLRPTWPTVVQGGFVCAWYIGGTLGSLVPIHLSLHGAIWLLVILGLVVASDTGGYVAGRTWGKLADHLWTPQRRRHPPCPHVSPGKTWAGFIGGAVATLTIGAILGLWHRDWSYLILASAIAVAAPLGDLFASWLKRRLGIKDWSQWLGHHGGFLDRLDSLTWAAAASYIVLITTGHIPV